MESCGTGRVARLSGGRAVVVIVRREACGSCQSADLCNTFSSRGTLDVEAENPLGACVGQTVEVSAARALGLRAAFLVYLLPALFFVAGVVVAAEVFGWPPLGSGLGGLATMAVAWLIAWRYDRSAGRRKEFRLTITRVL